MSTCAQNQSNQDEEGGAGSGAGAGPPDHADVMDHSGANHFLQQQQQVTQSSVTTVAKRTKTSTVEEYTHSDTEA